MSGHVFPFYGIKVNNLKIVMFKWAMPPDFSITWKSQKAYLYQRNSNGLVLLTITMY